MIIWLIVHIIGDFYFQSNEMVQRKLVSLKCLINHSFIYSILYIIPLLFEKRYELIIPIIFILFISHLLIDKYLEVIIPFKFAKISERVAKYILFYLDQFLHMIILYFIFNYYEISLFDNLLIRSIFVILLLGMPSSIIVSKTLALVNDDYVVEFKVDEGTIIGILERMLILLLGFTNAIGGIGFVIAAKTMVRYGQFDDKDTELHKSFRTKYLIGTLTSVLLALIGYLILSI